MSECNEKNAALEQFSGSIARLTEQGASHETAIPGLSHFQRTDPTGPISGMYQPSIAWSRKGPRA